MSAEGNEIVCVLELTRIELQALRALVDGTNVSPSDNPNDPIGAIWKIWYELSNFSMDAGIPKRSLSIDCSPIMINGWAS